MGDAFTIVVILFVAGLFLVIAEVFLPGMVAGIVGFLCMAIAVVVAYANFGMVTGTFFLIAALVAAFGLVVCALTFFPKTPMGRRIMLERELEHGMATGNEEERKSLLGREGISITALRPAGAARINGRKWDVVAEGNFIEEGVAVTVVEEEGVRIVVRQLE